ncbi:hypothetical protein QBC46DRAFT_439570 [Diplogelasinospora grovesii]|uniref:Zn(2)-C6 fungal-type domain-containing protein n=1 Tax=Diplogelasinospora grovesii TaxID=303347 RepID=A0AAN6N457_9PEZI|nr:hypothetical protein QBC46DRAFT_439570 [Diplogelasinospora grovesii]
MASAYRPIKSTTPVLWPSPGVSLEGLGKRIPYVSQACRGCRHAKVKCDGGRPTCRTCIARGRSCHYDGQAGQSRKAATRSRMKAMEKLFVALKAKPASEAEVLLQRIRATDDILTLVDGHDAASSPSSGSCCSSSGLSSSTWGLSRSSPSSSYAGPDKPPPRPIPRTSICETTSLGPASLAGGAGSVSPPASDRHLLDASASSSLIRLVMPSAAITQAALRIFYRLCGRLFHVFSQQQIARYYADLFENDDCPIASQKTAACCVSAVAAVGVHFSPDEFDEGIDTVFYNVATHYFSHFLEEEALDAIKVCSVFAYYNVMNKATAALAYIEVGLNMSKRHSLHIRNHQHPGMSSDEWTDYRKTWRSLVFFSSWLSASLGYVSRPDTPFREMVPKLDLECDNPYDITGVVQTEMTKIVLLKAEILRLQLAFKELTGPAVDSINTDLQEWHDRLPREMRLEHLGRLDLLDEVMLSIFSVHLLYLGAIMLLYRRIASQFVKSFRFDRRDDTEWKSCQTALLDRTMQGLIAAKTSARILGLMLAKGGVFKSFQSQTSCVVLLHEVAQKQLHNFPRLAWEEDLAQASVCLEALAFCGTADPVALSFHAALEPVYARLASFSSRIKSEDLDTPPTKYLLTIPQDADPALASLSLTLLQALCRPFGDDERNLGAVSGDVNARSASESATSMKQDNPLCRMDERLDWAWKDTVPVQWDHDDLGIGTAAPLPANRCFLGSVEPSGWAAGRGDL